MRLLKKRLWCSILLFCFVLFVLAGCNKTANEPYSADRYTLVTPTIYAAEVPTDIPVNSPTEAPTEAPVNSPTDVPTEAPVNSPTDVPTKAPVKESDTYHFRSDSLLQEHFEKHGGDFGYTSATQYESGASAVINSPDALHKTEAEDGDSVYYIEATNEFVILSTDGYIRTYFRPEDGIEYYNRQ